MLELSGSLSAATGLVNDGRRRHYRVSTNPALPKTLARTSAFLYRGNGIPDGFALYLALASDSAAFAALPPGATSAVLPDSAHYLADGDIVRLAASGDGGAYRVVFRRSAPHQSILLTERCNHYCLMCSQPPRDIQDDWLMDEVEALIPMLPADTHEIGFTGGEPTIYGDRLIALLKSAERWLPRTAVHLLSNGRRFSDFRYAQAYADIRHHDLMVGIPLYSDDPATHNYVVQADRAFDETIAGILNLKRLGQRVEIRVVIHAQTIERLPKLAQFIARNLLFVDHVALMGLEMTGFTKGNLKQLWIDPYDYQESLQSAVDVLKAYRIRTSIYNHQLCVVPPGIRDLAVQSISDWKREYLEQCRACDARAACGGFFSSGARIRHSDHIAPIQSTGYFSAA